MADDTELPNGTGGDVIRDRARTSDAGVIRKTQIALLDVGGEDAERMVRGQHRPVPIHERELFALAKRIGLALENAIVGPPARAGVGGPRFYASSTVSTGIDPATLALTLFYKADFPGGTSWSGTASTGSSGTNAATEATNPPTQGTAVSGHIPAKFNGTNQLLTTGADMSAMFSATAMTFIALVNVTSAPGAAAVGTPYLDPGVLSFASQGYYGMGVNSTGLRVYAFDGAYREIASSALPFSTGALQALQMKWDGVNLKGRVNRGTWQSVACGTVSNTAGFKGKIGTTYDAASAFLAADGIEELIGTNIVLDDPTCDGILDHFNAVYGTAF